MNHKSNANKALTYALSWTLALQPVVGLLPASAVAQVPSASSEASLINELVKIGLDIDKLMDRTAYPLIPRIGSTGLPSASDANQIEKRLADIHDYLQKNILSRIMSNPLGSPSDSDKFYSEFYSFFEVAAKLETLKLNLNQDIQPEKWNSAYGFSIPADGLSQLNFFAALSYYSQNDSEIKQNSDPKYDVVRNSKMSSKIVFDRGRSIIQLSLNPNFLSQAQAQQLISQVNTRGVLTFAAYQTADMLYESQAATLNLTQQKLDSLPAPTALWQERFPIFRVKQNLVRQTWKNQMLAKQKPILTSAVAKSISDLEKQGLDGALNESFWKQYSAIAGSPQTDFANFRLEESKTFKTAFEGLVRLWNLDQLQETLVPTLRLAKRLSLRYMMFENPRFRLALTTFRRSQMSDLIDQYAEQFASQHGSMISSGPAISKIINFNPEIVRREQRNQFASSLRTAAQKINRFETEDINLDYLIRAQSAAIAELKVSSMVQSVVAGLQNKSDYTVGYAEYREKLLTILQAYTVNIPQPLSLNALYTNKDQIAFNPKALESALPPAYIQALATNVNARKKDISDLLEIGRLLKFDVYESLPAESVTLAEGQTAKLKRATPTTLKLQSAVFEGLWGSEKTRYQEEMQKDLYKSAPILGENDLWKTLATKQLDTKEETSLIQDQIQTAYQKATQNLASLEIQFRKIENGADDQLLNQTSEEMRTIVLRAARMKAALMSQSNFSGYYEEIQKELMEAGFWEREWDEFNTSVNNANLYLFGLVLASAFARPASGLMKAWNPLPGQTTKLAARMVEPVKNFFSPIFGQNLTYIFNSMAILFGVKVAADSGKAYSENNRLEILRKYFSCSADRPCVTLYDDVTSQRDIRTASLTQVFIGAAGLSLVGIAYYSSVSGFFSQKLMELRMRQIEADLRFLNVKPDITLSRKALEEALVQAQTTARLQSNPVAGELAAAYAEKVFNRINSRIWKNVAEWKKADIRFQGTAEKLGMNLRSIKNPEALAKRLSDLDYAYGRGQISTMNYLSYKISIFRIYQQYAPIWANMDKNPAVRSFYNAVWDASTGISGVQARASFTFFNERQAKQFTKMMDEFYGTDSGRLEDIAKRIMAEMDANPNLSQQRIGELRKLLTEELKK